MLDNSPAYFPLRAIHLLTYPVDSIFQIQFLGIFGKLIAEGSEYEKIANLWWRPRIIFSEALP